MTISTTTSEIVYAGLTGQDTFAYDFRVDDKTHMNVHIDNVPVAQGDFTMTGLGDNSGGNVVLNTPLVADATVLLFRMVPSTQEVNYQPFDAFESETHEGALDKLTMLVQQNDTSVNRSLRFPDGDTANPVIPDSAARQDKYLAFDSSGDVTVLDGTTGDPNSVQKPVTATTGNLMQFDANKDAVDSGESASSIESSAVVTANAYTDAAVLQRLKYGGFGGDFTGNIPSLAAAASQQIVNYVTAVGNTSDSVYLLDVDIFAASPATEDGKIVFTFDSTSGGPGRIGIAGNTATFQRLSFTPNGQALLDHFSYLLYPQVIGGTTFTVSIENTGSAEAVSSIAWKVRILELKSGA